MVGILNRAWGKLVNGDVPGVDTLQEKLSTAAFRHLEASSGNAN